MDNQLLAVRAVLTEMAPDAAVTISEIAGGHLVEAAGIAVRCERFGPFVVVEMGACAYRNVQALDRAFYIESRIGSHMDAIAMGASAR